MSKWNSIPCQLSALDIGIVLKCGQSFRWDLIDGCWIGVLSGKVWQLKQDDTRIWYKTHGRDQRIASKRKTSSGKGVTYGKKAKMNIDDDIGTISKHRDQDKDILYDYFQLGINLTELCNHWSRVDTHFDSIHKKFKGVRMLRQDPMENLFSFICSSNNNITRIASMVEKMCQSFGDKIATVDGKDYHNFPEISALAKSDTEDILRKLGFGYRAKYIHQSAVKIAQFGGSEWLYRLRSLPYADAHAELTKLPGIGAKVADCICMMSLDKSQAIPVDTHVWQIAVRDYKITTLKNTKTLTAMSYKLIGEHFRNLWGNHASWAMNFLFVADLKQFQHRK